MREYVDTLGEIYLERARYLLNTDEAQRAEIRTGEQLRVCSDNCRKFVAIATA
jgi:hypothetical protein